MTETVKVTAETATVTVKTEVMPVRVTEIIILKKENCQTIFVSYTLLCWPKATFTFKSQTLVIAKTKIIKISVMLTEFKKFKLVL